MKKIKPRESSCLNKTTRTEGMPEGVAVDNDIASGSLTISFLDTSENQMRNWSRGEEATVVELRTSVE